MSYKKSNPNGSATSANSEPVVIASDQSPIPVSSATFATSAKQDILLAELQLKADLTETQPVSAVSLPLPTGAATSAAQTTGNASVASIDTKLPAQGQALAAASLPVVLTAAQVATLTPQTNALTDAQLRATAVPVSVAGVATEATLSSLNTKVATAKTFDLDSGVGTDTVQAIGIAVAASGGSVAVTGDTANGLDVDVTRLPALPAGTNNIGDVDVLTVNGVAPAFGTGVRGATVQRVTVATDDVVPVTGTFFQATQPVSAVSLPLPTGAATLAGQTQPGVDIGDVTINNAAGVAAVNIQDGGNSITVDGTVAISGSVAVTGPLTDTQLRATAVPVSLASTTVTGTVAVTDNAGSLTVDAPVGTPAFVRLSDGTAAITTLPVSLDSVPSHPVTNAGTFLVQNNAATPAGTNNIGDVDVLTVNGVAPAFGSGVRSATVQRVTIATDDIVPASQTGVWTVQPGNTPNTTPWLVNDGATATGGYTPNKLISAATTNATVIKASAGTLGYVQASNINASPRYLKFYNKATTPVVGTDVPVHVWLIPGNTAGAGTNIPLPSEGVNFTAGISFAITAGATDADATAVAVSEIIVNYGTI